MDLFNSDLDASHQQHLWRLAACQWQSGVLPGAEALARARQSLAQALPDKGIGFESSRKHILEELAPALNGSSISPNYYGFVTGGVTPAALFADNIVSAYDQNVHAHLPRHSIVTDVEFRALGLLVDLFELDRKSWHNGTFTTGATASNLLGLACGREFVLQAAFATRGLGPAQSTGESGLFEVMCAAGVTGIQVLSTMPHSSLGKAAGILGIGRANVKTVGRQENPLCFDMAQLERELGRSDKASIVAVSCGEVNTGRFATTGLHELRQLRKLCDQYGSWLHVDGAFGIFGRVLEDGAEFASIKRGCEGLELADSIGGDGHKLLNVPYDCGFFLCRHLQLATNVFQNANAAYLNSGRADESAAVPSPLNIGIENSRRFRALPVYASLLAYGRTGYRQMLQRQVRLARMIAGWLYDHPHYILLPNDGSKQDLLERTYLIVLFRATNSALNEELEDKINATSKIFVSGTSWSGQPACRIAIANWRVDEERDFSVVKAALDSVFPQESFDS